MANGPASQSSSSSSSDGSNDFQSNCEDENASVSQIPTIQSSQAMEPIISQPFSNFRSSNAYHLPTSNLPQEFRLDSSSRVQVPPMQPFYSQVPIPLGSNNGGEVPMFKAWTNWNPQNQFTMNETLIPPLGPQDLQLQALLNQQAAMPYQMQHLNPPFHHQAIGGTHLGAPISYPVDALASSSLHNIPSSSNSRPARNSVYDPAYEAMGLCVDPHLRMFVAGRKNGGNGGAS